MTTDTEKEFIETVIPADQARLYERDGWDIIGYREDGAERVADIRRRCGCATGVLGTLHVATN